MASRRRTKRAPLSRERILDVAAEVLEREGPAAFSMRSLGQALGVEAMSLYHHFPSKAHLQDGLLDRLVASIPPPDPALPWRARLREASRAYRATLLTRPAFAHFALTHRMNTPVALSYLERVVGLFAQAGFGIEEQARAFRSLGYYLSGALLDETAGYARGPSAAEPLTLDEQRRLAPTLLAMGPYFAPKEWERTFLFGLDLLIDAFEARRKTSRS